MIDEDGEEKITMEENEIYRPIETHVAKENLMSHIHVRSTYKKMYMDTCTCTYVFVYTCTYKQI